jgi:DNA-binding response OmpR family regulator
VDVKKALILDDDIPVTAMYAAAFEDAGFEVRTATSGAAGFAALQVFMPDVVILDLNMPGNGGLRWLAAARRMPAFEKVPVIVVTGAAPDSSKVRAAMDALGQGVLSQRVRTPEMLVAAARWAAQRRRVSTVLSHAA